MDSETVFLANKTMVAFLIVLTAGVLLTGGGVGALGYGDGNVAVGPYNGEIGPGDGESQNSDSGILIGPEVERASLEVGDDVKVTTSEEYGLFNVHENETFQVDMEWEEVPVESTLDPTNEFNITVYRNGEITTIGPDDASTKKNGNGDLTWNFTETTETADYSVTIEGLQGATNYTIQMNIL